MEQLGTIGPRLVSQCRMSPFITLGDGESGLCGFSLKR